MLFILTMFRSTLPQMVRIISFDSNNLAKESNLDSGNLVT